MSDNVWVLGVHMTPFGRFDDRDLMDLGSAAALGALNDAGVTIHDMGVLAAGSIFQAAAGVGQLLQKQIGQTGIPVYNVVNACATGATAFRTVLMAIRAGDADMGLAVGMEQMGKLGLLPTEGGGPRPTDTFERRGRDGSVISTQGILGTGQMPGVFATAGMEYARRHAGVGLEQFAKVAEKNHANSTLNPLAQYRKRFSLDEILASPMMSYPNTVLMCCPTGDGAAAAVLVSEERLRSLSDDQRRRAVKVSASVLTTDPWSEGGEAQPDFNTLTRNAAALAYEQSGMDPADLDLVELHDCFATAELLHYENLGLCAPGEAGRFIDEGGPRRDGRIPVNVSGGLLSKVTRSGPRASPTSTRLPPICAVRLGIVRSQMPRSGSPTCSASARPVPCTCSNGRCREHPIERSVELSHEPLVGRFGFWGQAPIDHSRDR